ncbi:MAG: hypothetical protein JSU65_13790 [Candidatus Zixiibacteriota bacterium]|nr:MAG: hypothetical protein JSU65_13790 [candidate division Zixibacteria bacterium]
MRKDYKPEAARPNRMRAAITFIIIALFCLAPCSQAVAQQIVTHYDCGEIVEDLNCVRFVPDYPGPDGTQSFELIEWGEFEPGDRVYAEVTYYSGCLLGPLCWACEVISNTIDSCTTCCVGLTGDINCDGLVDIGDLTKFICFMWSAEWWDCTCCLEEANCDGSNDGVVDMGDLTKMIDYLFISYTPLAPC